jgi:3-phosphoshikimate 1-carboxyvinyltransferase
MRVIEPLPPGHATVSVPGSKSYSHRMLIAAALSDGACMIENCLDSEDCNLTIGALAGLGVAIERRPEGVAVVGRGGSLAACPAPVDLGNSGTSLRLLTAVAALGQGAYVLTGNERMQARPVQDLLDALSQAGASARSLKANGCPPVEIEGRPGFGGRVALDCSLSSQYLSALLLVGPCTAKGLEIAVSKGPVSKPYVDLTLDTMERFGVHAERRGYEWFRVPGGQRYRAGDHRVAPDASQAGYFWAAAAVTGGTVTVAGMSRDSRQGDVRLLDVLEKMGCRVTSEPEGVAVTGGPLAAVEVDMGDMPDVVPTLAVVAAFAAGTTVVRNVAHLKAKESDRLAAAVTELRRMGVAASCDADSLRVTGGAPRGALIETYDDHRIAMSFAVAGLRAEGVMISNPGCVQKSFPGFWEVFGGLY